jgi:hypothetical protein
MSRSYTIDQEQVRKVVKRVVERSASRQPIVYPRYNSEEGPPLLPRDDEDKKERKPRKK